MKTSNIKDLIKQITGDMDAPRDQSLSNSYNPKGVRNPFAALPNVKSFKVEVNTYDPLLEKYGISRKLDPELKFERLSSKIRGTNRYLRIIFEKMVKLLSKGQVKAFWIYALMLMRRSRAIRLSALRQLEHNWHIVFENKKVRTMLVHLDRFLIKGSRKFLIKRRYEDKIKPDGSKTYRPIGAPSYSARMLLYILYCFFSIFLGSYIRSYQHAYRRGKGLVTAWRDLSSKIKHYRNSYEFDLKGFFPGINNSYIMWKLTDLGVPKAFSDYIFDLNMEYPAKDTLDESKLSETNAKYRAELDAIGLLRLEHKKSLSFDIQLHESEVLKPMWEFLKSNATEQFEQRVKTETNMTNQELFDDCFSNCEELLISMMSEDLGYGYEEIKENWMACLYEYYQVQAALFESFKPQATPTPITTPELSSGKEAPFNTINLDSSKGLPQGGSLSPILSIFAFEQFLVRSYFEQIFNGKDFSLVAYADDFILLWNDDSITEKDITQKSDVLESSGIEFSLEKSKPIRTAGKFVTEKFKFLGKTYFPELDSVVGTPRSGKVNELPLSDVIEQYGKRHALLESFSKEFSLDLTPQEILNSWGRGEFPLIMLPDSLMHDSEPLSIEQKRFLSVALSSGVKNLSQFEELYPQLAALARGDVSSVEASSAIKLPAPVGLGTTIEELDSQWQSEIHNMASSEAELIQQYGITKSKLSSRISESSFTFRPSSGADPADLAKYTGGSGNPFAYLEHKDISGFITSRLLDKGFVTSEEILPRIGKPRKSSNPKSWLSYAKERKSYVNINLFNSSSYATLSLLNSNLFNTYGKVS